MTSKQPTTYKRTPKLILDQADKDIYKSQYRNLKFYVRMGLIITKFHKIVFFKQSHWLAKYIMCNTNCDESL